MFVLGRVNFALERLLFKPSGDSLMHSVIDYYIMRELKSLSDLLLASATR